MDPDRHDADMLIRLATRTHAERGHLDVHRVDTLLAEHRVGLDAGRCDDIVLQQPVGDDDVGPHQLLTAGDLLAQDRAMVDDELQVEVRDVHARVAFARGRLTHVAASPPEAKVAALDRVEQKRTVDLLSDREHERGVAFELGQPESGPQRGDDRSHQVCEDLLGVIELDAGEVARVARDVGDHGDRPARWPSANSSGSTPPVESGPGATIICGLTVGKGSASRAGRRRPVGVHTMRKITCLEATISVGCGLLNAEG